MAKKRKTLRELLDEAMAAGSVHSEYQPLLRYSEGELPEEFAERLVAFAAQPQFASTILNGKQEYVSFGVAGPIETPHGTFELIPAEVIGGQWATHYFLFYPSLVACLTADENFIRLDSGCTSGQVFSDVTCDCREQLHLAMQECTANKTGIIVSIPAHDGRGWGEFKMANQLLMSEYGLDTVAAARLFYGDEQAIDQRTYTEAVLMLRTFGFGHSQSFKLATNNPRKVGAFQALGMKVTSVQPVVSKSSNAHVMRNLKAKQREWGHTLGFNT